MDTFKEIVAWRLLEVCIYFARHHKIQGNLFQVTTICPTHFSQDSIAKSICLDKKDNLNAGHGSTIVGILRNLKLVELVTIKFTDKINFTFIAVALGGMYNVKQLVGITKLVCPSPSPCLKHLHTHTCLELVLFLTRTHASSTLTHTSVNKLNIQLLVLLSPYKPDTCTSC